MIDHIGFSVADYARSRAFYVAALAPLGFVPVIEVSKEQTGDYEATGLGPAGRPQLWIGNGEAARGPTHIALVAESRAAVDAFYQAALNVFTIAGALCLWKFVGVYAFAIGYTAGAFANWPSSISPRVPAWTPRRFPPAR